jgi:tetratricopeptide (TPR) repeat protein
MVTWIAATVMLSLSATVPLAEDPAFQDGMKLFDQLEFEQAAFRFEQAALDSEREPGERAQAFLWLGISYANAGRFELAKPALEKAFFTDENVVVPPDQSPTVLELVEEAKASAAARRAQVKQPPPPANKPAPETGPPVLLLAGGGLAVLGVASLTTSVVLGVLTGQSLAVANDKDQFFEDAKAAQDSANGFVAGAIVTGVLGVVLGAGGGALIAVSLME